MAESLAAADLAAATAATDTAVAATATEVLEASPAAGPGMPVVIGTVVILGIAYMAYKNAR